MSLIYYTHIYIRKQRAHSWHYLGMEKGLCTGKGEKNQTPNKPQASGFPHLLLLKHLLGRRMAHKQIQAFQYRRLEMQRQSLCCHCYPIAQLREASGWCVSEHSLILLPAYIWGLNPSEGSGWGPGIQGYRLQKMPCPRHTQQQLQRRQTVLKSQDSLPEQGQQLLLSHLNFKAAS